MVEMKDSEIKWIGNIPKHWEVHPVYSYFSERKNKNRLGKEQNLLSLSYGSIIKKDINSNGGLLPESFNTYNIIEENDIIIRPTDLQNDKRSLRTGLVKEHGIITSAYIDMKPKKEVNSHYFHYLLHSYDIQKVFYNMGNGVRQALNFSEFSKLMVFAPPLKEQNKIADFLDEKCAEIDSISAEIQEQINTLEEYKKSVITEAVTKGLNPNAEMKDSGIEWIGQISKDWDVTKIKYNALIKGRIGFRGYTEADLVDEGEGAITLSPSNFLNMKMNYNKCSYISWFKYNESPEIKISNDDILFVKTGSSYGKSCLVKDLPMEATINPQLIVFKDVKINNGLLAYILQTEYIISQSELAVVGGTIPTMSQNKIGNFNIVVPTSEEEQSAIVEILNEKCNKIDGAIEDKQKQLEVLEEYKKTLIYEYVTGKKEVA